MDEAADFAAADLAATQEIRDKISSLDRKLRRRTLEEMMAALNEDEDEDMAKSAVQSRQSFRPRKLRSFSGNADKAGEVDYATWSLYARSIVDDTSIGASEKKRILLESLLNPALEIAAAAASKSSATELLDLLDQHFGEVADGYDLYSQFRASVQGTHETASEFLQRLELKALKVVAHKGLKDGELTLEVVRQFENGCADDDLLQRVGIRELVKSPPSVASLLQKVRTEETRRREKKLRLKARTARANVVTTCETSMAAEMKELKGQLQALTLQVQELTVGQQRTTSGATAQQVPTTQVSSGPGSGTRGRFQNHSQRGRGNGRRRPFTGFCFHCGQQGHMRGECEFDRNADLVQQRLLDQVQGGNKGSNQTSQEN